MIFKRFYCIFRTNKRNNENFIEILENFRKFKRKFKENLK